MTRPLRFFSSARAMLAVCFCGLTSAVLAQSLVRPPLEFLPEVDAEPEALSSLLRAEQNAVG